MIPEPINPDIPPTPRACTELLALAARDDIGASIVADVVGSDPRMSVEVIRVSNSAFYGRRSPARSPRAAVVTMGIRDAVKVAVGVTLIGELLPPNAMLRLDEVVDFGLVAAAAWASFGEAEATAGMLTTAGLVAMAQYPDRFQVYVDAAPSVSSADELHTLERQIFGLNRCEATDLVVHRWDVPQEIASVLRAWHDCRSGESALSDVLRSRADAIESPLLRTLAYY